MTTTPAGSAAIVLIRCLLHVGCRKYRSSPPWHGQQPFVVSQLSKRRIATYVFTYLICRACPRRAVTATSALDGIDFYTQRFLHNIHPFDRTTIRVEASCYVLLATHSSPTSSAANYRRNRVGFYPPFSLHGRLLFPRLYMSYVFWYPHVARVLLLAID